MLWKYTIGQDKTKKHLEYLLETNQVPHAQLITAAYGRGSLVMSIEFSLQLIGHTQKSETKQSLSHSSQHPNLHFIYPVVKKGSEKIVYAGDYAAEWYDFLDQLPYGTLTDWFEAINVGNKQGLIGVSEIEKLHRSLYLKSLDGANKVCILWGIEKMNPSAANAFLKLLEEPPEKTYFLLLCEDSELMLPTVRSRCQEISLPPIEEEVLVRLHPEESNLPLIKQAGGNYGKLLSLISSSEEKEFETLLLGGLRGAFKAKGNKSVVLDLMEWSNELALLGREKQKAFMRYSIQLFRDAFLTNYALDDLVYFKSNTDFDLTKLAPYIHSKNVGALITLFEEQHYYIQRNANAKMLFAELALQLTRLINKAED